MGVVPRTIAGPGPVRRSQDKHSEAQWTSSSPSACLPAHRQPGLPALAADQARSRHGGWAHGQQDGFILATASLQWLTLVRQGVEGGSAGSWEAQDLSSVTLPLWVSVPFFVLFSLLRV